MGGFALMPGLVHPGCARARRLDFHASRSELDDCLAEEILYRVASEGGAAVRVALATTQIEEVHQDGEWDLVAFAVPDSTPSAGKATDKQVDWARIVALCAGTWRLVPVLGTEAVLTVEGVHANRVRVTEESRAVHKLV